MKAEGSFFKSIYFMIVIFVCIGVVLPCVAIGGIAADQIKKITMNYSNKHVVQMADSVMSLAETGESLAIEIYQDKDIIPLLYSSEISSNEIMRAMIRLRTYSRSNSEIESIYIYNRASDYVYSTLSEGRSKRSDFFDTELNSFLQGQLEWGRLAPIPRTLNGTNVYTFVYHEGINILTGQYDNVVIVNINQKTLDVLLTKKGKENLEEAFVISSEGCLMSNYKNMNLYTDMSDQPFIQEVLEASNEEGRMIIKSGREEYLMCYQKMEELGGWIFIDMIYYSSLKQPIINIIFWCIGVVIVCSIFLNLFAYRISRRVYRPIASMESKFLELKDAYQKSGFVMKNAVFQNFLYKTEQVERKQIEEIIEKYHLNMIIESSTKLISIKMKEDGGWREKFVRMTMN